MTQDFNFPKFAINALNNRVIGSTQDNPPFGIVDNTNDPTILFNNSAFQDGLASIFYTDGGIKKLSYEELNALILGISIKFNAMQEKNLSQWISTITYEIGTLLIDPTNSHIYLSLVNNNLGNVLTDNTKWFDCGDIREMQFLNINVLDPTNYGDFNSTNWLSLENRKYVMLATDVQLTNSPFKETAAANYFITIDNLIKNISGTNYYTQKFTILEIGSTLPPFIFQRSFVNTQADMINRGFEGYNSNQTFSFYCSVTGLTQAVAPNATYNLFANMTNANDVLNLNNGFQLKYTNGTVLTTFFIDATNKFLFPSNLKSANRKHANYIVRVILNGTLAGANDSDWEGSIRMRKSLDNSIMSEAQIFKTRNTILNNATLNFIFPIVGETDTLVVDGCYFELYSSVNNADTLTLNSIQFQILGTF